MSRDVAGNLVWSAAGLTLGGLNQCNQAEASVAKNRVDRTYDSMGRLSTLRFADGNGNQDWSYWPSGAVRQIRTINGGTVASNLYQFNNRGLLTGESLAQEGGATFALGYGYSPEGHLASHQYPGGQNVVYAPNALGQPTRAGDHATHVSYFPNGAMSAFHYGNGLVHRMVQNTRGLPERSEDASPTSRILDDSYDYDPNGNVVAISDGLPGSRSNRDMVYDGLDRLIGANSLLFGSGRYGYDVLDNLTRVEVAGRNHGYLYDPSNRLTNVVNLGDGATVIGLTYDVQGNLALKNGQAFQFDSGNRLRQALGREAYRYDGHGRRIQSNELGRGDIYSLYGSDGVLRFQKNDRDAESIVYVHLNGSLVARVNSPSEPASPTVKVPGYATDGAFTVTWDPIKGATRYELSERTDGEWIGIFAGADRELHLTGRSRQQYSYRARACNGVGCSGWGPAASIFVELPPTAPGSLSAPSLGLKGNYTVSWTAPMPRAVGETAYALEEAALGGAWAEVQRASSFSRSFSGRPAGSYGYRVRACNPYGCGAYTAAAWVQVVYPPSPPILNGVGEQLSGSFQIAWSQSTGTASYQLDESFNGGAWSRAYEGAGVFAMLSGRQTGQYRYRAQACGEGGCSAPSEIRTVSVTVAPNIAPDLSVPASSTSGSYSVSWNALEHVAHYQLYERQPGGGLNHVHSTEAAIFGAGGRWTGRWGYAVQACNRAGCGPLSRERIIDVLLPPQVPAFTTGARVANRGISSTAFSCYVNWSAVANVDRYEVRDDVGGLATVPPSQLKLETKRQIGGFPKTLVCSTRLEIRACNAAGCSGWSPVWTQVRLDIDSRI